MQEQDSKHDDTQDNTAEQVVPTLANDSSAT